MVAAAAIAIAAVAWTRPDAPAAAPPMDVAAELAAMRAELAAIRARDTERWLDEQRADQVRGVVRSVLEDSASRTAFAGDGTVAGYDHGFVLAAVDGSYLFRINCLGQVRLVWNNNYQATGTQPPAAVPDSGTNRNDRNTWGVEMRRMQLYISGHAIDPSLEYVLGAAYDSQPDPYFEQQGVFGMIYMEVRKHLDDRMTVSVGRQNAPFTAESTLFNAGFAQMGEYSVFEYRAGIGQQTGVALEWKDSGIRWQGGMFDDVVPIPGNVAYWDSLFNASVAFASRLELKPFGTWEQFAKESSFRGEDPGLVLGAGVAWATPRSQNSILGYDVSTLAATADARLDLGGANAIAQMYWSSDTPSGAAQWGLNVQGGLFLADDVEAFGALSWFDVADPEWFVQGGANLYLHGNALKATLMVIVPLGGSHPGASTPSLAGTGVSDVADNFSVLAQMQMMY